MKSKRKLKPWVRISLFVIPIAVIIIQLFLVGLKISKDYEKINRETIIVEYRYSCRCRYE